MGPGRKGVSLRGQRESTALNFDFTNGFHDTGNAMAAAFGMYGVLWAGLIAKVMIPALLVPVVAVALIVSGGH